MQGGRASFTGPHINHSLPGPGPAKKRKGNPGSQRHWDDPEQQSGTLPYDDDGTEEIEEDTAIDGAEEEEESRELTYDEIWDDSALIAAWESATVEYEAYHGKGKDWKTEPAKKSPLWYNVPPDPSKLKMSAEVVQESGAMKPDPENSRPLDFETFVPNHDPSLAQPSQQAFDTYGIPPAPGEYVSRDEAFNRALGAMYWAGYWTAVYHSHEHNDSERITHEAAANGLHQKQEDENVEDQDEDEELLISTQR
ncbi:hypothetical protein BJV74DRAFT_813925 [Russula compacta]|nr:hypothetical protein BJV74DRAFT_813925 [Russula compacta]